MLLRWFVALYEADIIQETVFLKWKEDVNDAYPGKGKALFQASLPPPPPTPVPGGAPFSCPSPWKKYL